MRNEPQHLTALAALQEPKSTASAYFLCCLGFMGAAGIHRFYLGKYGSGLLYLFTFGFMGIGTVMDLFRIPEMVEDTNFKMLVRQGLLPQNLTGAVGQPTLPSPSSGNVARLPIEPELSAEKKIETTVLNLARTFQGRLTALELAANSRFSLDEADVALQDFVRKGYAEMTVADNGSILYEFHGFLQFETKNTPEAHPRGNA